MKILKKTIIEIKKFIVLNKSKNNAIKNNIIC